MAFITGYILLLFFYITCVACNSGVPSTDLLFNNTKNTITLIAPRHQEVLKATIIRFKWSVSTLTGNYYIVALSKEKLYASNGVLTNPDKILWIAIHEPYLEEKKLQSSYSLGLTDGHLVFWDGKKFEIQENTLAVNNFNQKYYWAVWESNSIGVQTASSPVFSFTLSQ